MQCPNCNSTVDFPDVSAGRCAVCDAKIYFDPPVSRPRALIAGALAIGVNFRWYPLNGSLVSHFLWLAACALVYFAVIVVWQRARPPQLALVPPYGPLALGLSSRSRNRTP